MMQWINENSGALQVVSSTGLLLVWVVYLQMFLIQYRRHATPSIIISRGGGVSLKSRCLISNMSGEAIHIQAILASLHEDGGIVKRSVTDRRELEDEDGAPKDAFSTTRQGPLLSGHMMDAGSFAELLGGVSDKGLSAQATEIPDDIELPITMDIQVVAIYGSEDLLVSAKRSFRLERVSEEVCVFAESVETEQIRSRRERRKLAKLLSE